MTVWPPLPIWRSHSASRCCWKVAPGVGKTEAAKALTSVLGRQLIRLQCYEGIDASTALYEWNYPRQMLAIRQAEDEEIDIYHDRFLIERPMLAALRAPERATLLLDEIDRSDHEFEAFLLEFLSDFQITIPERGTVRAPNHPVVILTSNRTRELHEALRRRCVYHWIDYPDAEREAQIVMMRASSVAEATARAVVAAVGLLRAEPLNKPPGVAETIEWAEAGDTPQQYGRTVAASLPARHRRGAQGRRRSVLPRAAYRTADLRSRCMTEPVMPRAALPFVEFASLVRSHGFSVASEQTTAFLSAIDLLGPRNMSDIRRAAHATMAPPVERRAEFDALFNALFMGAGAGRAGRQAMMKTNCGFRTMTPVISSPKRQTTSMRRDKKPPGPKCCLSVSSSRLTSMTRCAVSPAPPPCACRAAR